MCFYLTLEKLEKIEWKLMDISISLELLMKYII